jgi:hypothetical protein
MVILEKILRAKLFFSYNAAWTKALKSFLLQKRYERIFIFIGAWIINFSAFPPIIYMFQEYTRRITRICCHSHISLFYTEHFFWWKGLQSHIYALICCFIGQDSKKWSKTSCKNLWHFKTFFFTFHIFMLIQFQYFENMALIQWDYGTSKKGKYGLKIGAQNFSVLLPCYR